MRYRGIDPVTGRFGWTQADGSVVPDAESSDSGERRSALLTSERATATRPAARTTADQADQATARQSFDTAVSQLTRRGVSRRRAIQTAAARNPELHREAYGAGIRSKRGTPANKTLYSKSEIAALRTAWGIALQAERDAGATGHSVVIRAARKHPGLYQALSGKL